MTFAYNIRSISPHFTTSRTSANAQTSTSAFYRSPLCTVFCYWDRRRVSSFPLGYQQVVTLTIIQLRPLILCKMLIKTFIKTFDAEAQIAQIKTILTTKRKQWFNRNKYVNIFTLPSSFLLLPGRLELTFPETYAVRFPVLGTFAPWNKWPKNFRILKLSPWRLKSTVFAFRPLYSSGVSVSVFAVGIGIRYFCRYFFASVRYSVSVF